MPKFAYVCSLENEKYILPNVILALRRLVENAGEFRCATTPTRGRQVIITFIVCSRLGESRLAKHSAPTQNGELSLAK